MMLETLNYHTAEDGHASYGRDGGQGRDILIAPSRSFEDDCSFLEQIRSPDTSVAAVLEQKPDEKLQSALNMLMTAWNNVPHGNLTFLTAATPQVLRDEFIWRACDSFVRHKINISDVNMNALGTLHEDVCKSTYLSKDIFRQDKPVSFLMVYYPPASQPITLVHNWHDDVRPSTEGKITLNRSLNTDGIRFLFKEGAEGRAADGVGLTTGHTAFKISPENRHCAPPVSQTQGRVMYTMTGAPA